MRTFNSHVRELGTFVADWDQLIVKNEPQFFNASVQFAKAHGGMITKFFLESLPEGWDNAVVDSRVHMLMPGWYPCIPGWHHDDVPRSLDNGQPNYEDPEYHAEHLMGLVNGSICPTLFLQGPVLVPEPRYEGVVYEQWSNYIDHFYRNRKHKDVDFYAAPSGVYIAFDAHAFHEGQMANASGWRWFIRLSRNTVRQQNMTDEFRNQTQVYLPNPKQGW